MKKFTLIIVALVCSATVWAECPGLMMDTIPAERCIMDFQFNPEVPSLSFVDNYMKPGKPCLLNFNDRSLWTVPFMEELYSYSRQRACGMV